MLNVNQTGMQFALDRIVRKEKPVPVFIDALTVVALMKGAHK